MPRRLRWSDLVPGLVAVAALSAIVAAVLVYARVGALHGDTFRVYAPTGEARGVLPGSEVWLAGQRVGLVEEVRFAPPSVDPRRRVVLVLEVLERYRSFLRRDAYAQIRPGGNLIGAPVVWISSGTAAAPVLDDGDTLRTRPQGDVEAVGGQFALVARQFPELIANVKLVGAQVQSARGTMGALLAGEAARRDLPLLERTLAVLARLAAVGGRTFTLARDSELAGRVRAVAQRADSLRQLLASGRGELGRARRDSTLVREIAAVRDELTILRARLRTPHGTAGRLAGDSALVRELGQLERELGAVIEDVKRHPLRYVAF